MRAVTITKSFYPAFFPERLREGAIVATDKASPWRRSPATCGWVAGLAAGIIG
jgi:hypothetical protein